jgi:branched-chain amino acid transport system permease protein
MVGGVLISALEIFWAGYLSLAYRDVATFALLAVVLIWCPHGCSAYRSVSPTTPCPSPL